MLPFTWQTPTLLQAADDRHRLPGGFGHFLLIRAVEVASPTALAPFIYTQLVWSTLLAYIAFREFPDSASLLGMLVIVVAGLLAVDWKHVRAAHGLPSHKRSQEASMSKPTPHARSRLSPLPDHPHALDGQ